MSSLKRLFKKKVNGAGSGQDTDAQDEGEQYGLFTLHDGVNEAVVLDIVAVHGLGGHWRDTWMAENERLWLRDSIPIKMAAASTNARIFSYGYNANTAFSRAVTDITDEAAMLLDRIKSERKSANERKRPLIFIAHSLGGILVKKAMIIAHERTLEYGELLESIKGAMFLSTPHRGSDAAYWATFAASVLKTLQLGRGTNSNFVSALQRNSVEFANISQQWIERAAPLRIRTFYETERLHGELVVDKESARLGLVNEVAVGVAGADHRSICKFNNFGSQKYKPIEDATEDLAQFALGSCPTLEYAMTPDEIQSLQALYTSNYEEHRFRNPSREPGTCEWVLEDEQYREWQSKSTSSLLWISADPGCGKSVLSSYLYDYLKDPSHNHGGVVCQFFFKSDNEGQRTGSTAICAILHQLLSARPLLIKHARAQHIRKGAGLIGDLTGLWQLFLLATSDKDCGPVTLVLDGLDECEERSRGRLLELLRNFFQDENSTQYIKFIVASRPHSTIRNIMSESPTIRLKTETRLDAIDADVKRVVKGRLHRLMARMELTNQGPIFQLEQKLLRKADHTFLWVSLVLDMIDAASWASFSELNALLDEPHQDLDSLYENILAKVPSPAKARRLLNLVLGSFEPLTLEQLDIACAIRLGDKTLQDLEVRRFTLPEAGVIDTCSLFLRVVDDKVFFVHQTAREFLLSRQTAHVNDPKSVFLLPCGSNSNFRTWANSFDITYSQLVMAEVCIAYLLLEEFGGRTFRASEPLFKHASLFWPRYFALSQEKAHEDLLLSVQQILSDEEEERLWVLPWRTRAVNYAWDYSPSSESSLPYGVSQMASYLGFHTIIPFVYRPDCDSAGSHLAHSILRNHKQTVEALLKGGANPNLAETTREYSTPLHELARRKICVENKEMFCWAVDRLVNAGADLNALHKLHDITPLALAIRTANDLDFISHLLKGNAGIREDPISQDEVWDAIYLIEDDPGLDYYLALIQLLRQNGLDLERKPAPLLTAILRRSYPVTRALLELGVSQANLDLHGKTAYDLRNEVPGFFEYFSLMPLIRPPFVTADSPSDGSIHEPHPIKGQTERPRPRFLEPHQQNNGYIWILPKDTVRRLSQGLEPVNRAATASPIPR